MHELVRKIAQHQSIGIGVCLITIIVGLIYTTNKPFVYRSTTWLMVPTTTTTPEISSSLPELTPFIMPRSIESVVTILGSHDFLQQTFNGMSKTSRLRGFGSLTIADDMVTIDPKKDTNLINITVVAYSPSSAQNFANHIAENYLAIESTSRKDAIHKARLSLQQDRTFSLARLETVNAQVKELLAQNDTHGTQQAPNDFAQDTLSLQHQLVEARSQANIALHTMAHIDRQLAHEPQLVPTSASMKHNPLYDQIALRLDQLQHERDILRKDYTPTSSEVRAIDAQIGEEQQRLQHTSALALDATTTGRNTHYDYLKQQDTAYAEKMVENARLAVNLDAKLHRTMTAQPHNQSAKQQMDDLLQQQDSLHKQNERLMELDALLQVQENIMLPRGEIVVTATASQAPVSPNRVNMMVFFSMLGVVVAMMAAKGVEWLRGEKGLQGKTTLP